jgi:hypothetical protein
MKSCDFELSGQLLIDEILPSNTILKGSVLDSSCLMVVLFEW